MKKILFKNSIVALIVIGMMAPYFAAPYLLKSSQAHAQNSYNAGGYNVGGNSLGGSVLGSSGPGIVGYVSGLAPAIANLPLCREYINGQLKQFFSPKAAADTSGGGFTMTPGPYGGVIDAAKNIMAIRKQIEQSADDVSAAGGAVAIDIDQATKNAIAATMANTEENKKDTKKLLENETCLTSIAKLIIKLLVQKITLSTVAWIQGGSPGGPSFVRNPGEFFMDIARTAVLEFGLEISNPLLYPFGKSFIQSYAQAFNRSFAERARYSLDELMRETTPEYTSADFGVTFSKGGWNAWLFETQIPANNPLGFTLSAANEIAWRINNTAAQMQETLRQGDGFMGDRRCRDPKDLTVAEHNKTIEEGKRDAQGNLIGRWCKGGWEYVTPGKLVAEAATGLINYQSNTLLSVDTFNGAVAALVDALLLRLHTDLFDQGLAGLNTAGAGGGYVLGEQGFAGSYLATQAEQDYGIYANASTFLQNNPHFNIRTGLTQAVIDEQRTYVQFIEEQNIILWDWIKTARQLDYCIPGANPQYREITNRVLSAVKNEITSKTPADMEDETLQNVLGVAKTIGYLVGAAVGAAIGAGAGPLAPIAVPIGAAIGALIAFIVSLFDISEYKKLAVYYAIIGRSLTGIKIPVPDGLGDGFKNNESGDMSDNVIYTKQDLTNGLDKLYYQYLAIHDKYFNLHTLPTVTPEAYAKFNQINGYIKKMESNTAQVTILRGIITRLGELKAKMDGLNSDSSMSEAAYEEAVRPLAAEFGRIATEMVSGNDIAFADGMNRELKEDIRYIFETLITGTRGCEQELLTIQTLHPLIKQTMRASYPFEIWYDYNHFGPNDPLPNPQTIDGLKRYTTKSTSNNMPSDALRFGPGFLSAAIFDDTNNTCKQREAQWTGGGWALDCIAASDAFPGVASWPAWVGRNGYGEGTFAGNQLTSDELFNLRLREQGDNRGSTPGYCPILILQNVNTPPSITLNKLPPGGADWDTKHCQTDNSFEQTIGIY